MIIKFIGVPVLSINMEFKNLRNCDCNLKNLSNHGCLSVFIFFSVYLFVCLHTCLYIFFLFVCLFIFYLFVCLFIFIYLSNSMSVYFFLFYLSVCMSVYLFFTNCLCACLFMWFLFYLSVCTFY